MSASLHFELAIAELLRSSGLTQFTVLGDVHVVVTGISSDSRDVKTGDLFCCISGERVDGHSFAGDAISGGASAVVVERELDLASGVAQIIVPDVRHAIGPLSGAMFSHPSRSLTVVGVTGTNGKTSTATMLGHVLRASGRSVRVFGTLSGERTTAEAPVLQRQFAECLRDGVDTVVLEVSSHALAQHRVDGSTFALAVFTNLGRDHLDFHGTMEAYFAAKARLFEPQFAARGIANIDDVHGRLLCDSVDIPMVGFSRSDAHDVVVEADSVDFVWHGERMSLQVGGDFNVMNAVAVCTAAMQLGMTPKQIAAGFRDFAGVRGRFEYVDEGQEFAVIVDYAHTPDALEALLLTARRVTNGRVIVVFGCGGDRDKGKRALMGRAAQDHADVVFLTSDNPRSEDPHAIINEISSGFSPSSHSPFVEIRREIAIEKAIFGAETGDIVVIAGKGHETVQEFRDRVVSFDDVAVARDAVRKRSAIS